MDRNTFGTLSVAAFGLVLVSFVVVGFSRIVLPERVARLLAVPTVGLASVLVAVLLVRSVLAVTGVRPLE